MVIQLRLFSSSVPRNLFGFGSLAKSLKNTQSVPFEVKQVVRPVGLHKPPMPLNEMTPEEVAKVAEEKGFGLMKAFNEYFDKEKKAERIKYLEEEMAKGGLYDLHTFRKTKGKIFVSPVSYFKAAKSLYFPNVPIHTSLSKEDAPYQLLDVMTGNLTVLRCYANVQGETVTKDYFKIKDTTESYLTDKGYKIFKQEFPDAQIVELSLSENAAKGFALKLATGNLRKMVPEVRHNKYLIGSRKDLKRNIRDQLLMQNVYTGYIYVIDADCKIRWLAAGNPESQDIKTLWKSVKGLQKELLEERKKRELERAKSVNSE
ncbi:unnamed protein product [Kuraishia capsulata CBS 1993]|uniref:Mitochondrial ATPase complex subunit ATP10 n=1 Tax=Kuraishia capsulata CBS 1993 TaxID=1382522 RepID=W6MFT7_9ASCO|nr:uncharacterized protein KUCA_T00000750001 [Kuraishia capsulata CBS 1993]CDK24784.1 unnamed protein product [Kuraishia capsulata CBS 1993]